MCSATAPQGQSGILGGWRRTRKVDYQLTEKTSSGRHEAKLMADAFEQLVNNGLGEGQPPSHRVVPGGAAGNPQAWKLLHLL